LTQNLSSAKYSLKTQNGAAVALPAPAVYYSNLTLTPGAPLNPLTHYTFTLTPPANIAPPYSFDFVTGSSPDKNGPVLMGFSPSSGSTGVGVNGPFVAQFNKPLMGTSLYGGVSVSVSFLNGLALTSDGTGIVITPQVQGFPPMIQITVDPTKIKDAQGNTGQGPPQTAQYATFVATDTHGPVLRGSFPADGASGLPSNVDIRLLFDRPVNSASAKSITVTANGAAVPVQYGSFASGAGVDLKPQNLLPANAVCQVTVGAGLLDQNGFPITQSVSFRFTSNGVPDLVSPQSTGYSPSNVAAPVNAIVQFRANKPIMPLAATEFTSISGNPSVPATASISADGLTLTLTPQIAFTPGQNYSVNLSDIVDVTGAPFGYNTYLSFTAGDQTDSAPPAVLATNIADGAQGVLLFTQLAIAFSEPVFVPFDAVQLVEHGQPVDIFADSRSSALLLVQPRSSSLFDPSTTYTLTVNGVTDLAGLPLPAFSLQFTTAASIGAGAQVNLVSTSPAQGARNVDVNSSITFTFSANVSPMAAISGFGITDSAEGAYPCTAVVNGNTVTLTPSHPLLPNSAITASVQSNDPAGNQVFGQVSFLTGNSTDATPFQVTSISPSDGSTIGGQSATITLNLSAPVNPATIAAGLAVYAGGVAAVPKVTRSNGDTSLSFQVGSLTDFTVVATPALTNVAGTPLTNFQAHYALSGQPINTGMPGILEMRPAGGSSGVPANTEITWFLSAPVDLTAVRNSLVIVAGGAPMPGTFNLSSSGQVLTFTPSGVFPPGPVEYFQRAPIFTFYSSDLFQVAATPTTLQAVAVTPSSGGPANSLIEVQFSDDVQTGQGLVTLMRNGFSVPATESVPRPRVIRLTPTQPLSAGSYSLQISPNVPVSFGFSNAIPLTLTAPVTPATGNPMIGPQPNSTGTPINASIRVAFPAALNPLSVSASAVTLQVGGRTLGTTQRLTTDGRGLVVTPVEALPPNSVVNVAMSGLTDLFGNAEPAVNWSFTTGSTFDYTKPSIIQTSLDDTPGIPQIPANSSVVVVFDRQMDPYTAISARTGTIYPGASSNAPPVTAAFSGDLRTLTISAIPAFPKGMSYQLQFNQETDLSGNQSYSGAANLTFQTAFDPDTTPPRLLLVSPADGQSGLPLNTEIIASFDKPLMQTSFANISLVSGSSSIPLVVLTDDYRRARLAPATPLAPDTTYTMVVQGVTDLSGNSMAGNSTTSFTTAENLDLTAPAATSMASGAPNAQILILFNEPVSPATVDSHSVTLSTFIPNRPTTQVPLKVSLSSDGMIATVTPLNALTPGIQYQMTLSNVRDFAGNPAALPPGFITFTATTQPDGTLPSLIVTPPDGSTGVPLNVHIGAVATKSILPAPGLIQFSQNGLPFPGTLASNGSAFTFLPSLPLQPNTTYRLDIGQVRDLVGNTSLPVSSTFTTGSTSESSFSTGFKLVSASPANGDAGVDINAPIVLTFSEPVDPTSVGLASIFIFSSFPVTGAFSAAGNTVTFTPSEPWPQADTVSVQLQTRFGALVRDLAGVTLNANVFANPPLNFSFKTGASSDVTPPQLISVSPQPGTTLSPPSITFRLTFSETVTLGGGLALFTGAQTTGFNPAYDNSDYHTITFTANVPANSQLTLVGNGSIVDRAGNSLAPFSYSYPTSADNSAPPVVTSVTPANGSASVGPTTPIVIQFSRAMDPASVQQGVRITQDGDNFSGAVTLSSGNQTATFTPGAPYHAGSRIDVFVLETVADQYGQSISYRYNSFFTASPSASATQVVMSSFSRSVAPEGALELRFSRPLDRASVDSNSVWLRHGKRVAAGTALLSDDGLSIRFVPAEPLLPGDEYFLTVGPGLTSAGHRVRPEEFAFLAQAEPAVTIEKIDVVLEEGRPALRVHFSGQVSPLSISRALLMEADGKEIPADRRLSVDCRTLLLRPLTPAAGAAGMKLEDRGIEDRSGRRLAGDRR
jgi:methionine-rich copper-binding protein CopC